MSGGVRRRSRQGPSPASSEGAPTDAGVSDVVGSLLMLGLTVLAGSALLWIVWNVQAPEDPVSADLEVDNNSTQVDVVHKGGESIPLEAGRFVLTVDGSSQEHPLSEFESDVAAGNSDRWEVGEAICLSCQVTGTIETVTFVGGETVVLEWERS